MNTLDLNEAVDTVLNGLYQDILTGNGIPQIELFFKGVELKTKLAPVSIPVKEEPEPEKRTRKTKKEIAAEKYSAAVAVPEAINPLEQEPKEGEVVLDELKQPKNELTPEEITSIKNAKPEDVTVSCSGVTEVKTESLLSEDAPVKLTPEQRSEICVHATECKNSPKCPDDCNNRPDREDPIKSFYDCPRCKTNKGKALTPSSEGLVCSDCRAEIESKEAESEIKTKEEKKIICPKCKEVSEVPLIFNDKYPKAMICSACSKKIDETAEKEALTSIAQEATSLDEAIDQYEASKEPQPKQIDNSDIPETAEEDKVKDKFYITMPTVIEQISDRFKALSIESGISEEHMALWINFMRLNHKEELITDTTRLIDYINDAETIKFFVDKFNERLKSAA